MAIGTILTEVGEQSRTLDIINGVFQAISTGTFIYVTFFEILQDELSHGKTTLGRIVALIVGFGVMAALSAMPEPLPPVTTTLSPATAALGVTTDSLPEVETGT